MARKKSPRMVFRPQEPGLEKMLGALESQVMQVMWDADGARTVQEVRDELAARGKDAAYTTIMTTLGRLHAKGLLRRETRGKAYHYVPQVSRRELTDNMARQVVSGLVGSLAEPAIAYFVEALEKEAPEKLDTLAELLERKRAERKES
ncbi:MAG: BlaI/MecI/CopY family transcriptional regulator [candidate division WS1 bacterium]|jgi:predicted transcriptional regulator|nr:BlaI/MecI/CopY family transcriptional regulator [candidate division WS1 bacterium]